MLKKEKKKEAEIHITNKAVMSMFITVKLVVFHAHTKFKAVQATALVSNVKDVAHD